MTIPTHRLWAVLAASASVAAFAAPAFAATAVSGALNAVANATVSGVTVADNDNDSWAGGAFTNLATDVSATATSGALSVSTHGSARADWTSADQGSVLFRNYGWDFDAAGANGSESDLTQNRGGSDWSYTFTADGNGQIKMDYAVTGSGSTFGLQGWQISFTGAGAGGPVLNTSDPTTSGTFIGQLVAGQQYTISLNGNPNVSAGGGGAFSGSMLGEFDWQITEQSGGVPEPATWALMIGGFGLAGATLRRRRMAAA